MNEVEQAAMRAAQRGTEKYDGSPKTLAEGGPYRVGPYAHYDPHPRVVEQIEKAFRYHPPMPGQGRRYEQIREEAKELAVTIATLTPPSREQSIALTKLEEVVAFANAAIARNE